MNNQSHDPFFFLKQFHERLQLSNLISSTLNLKDKKQKKEEKEIEEITGDIQGQIVGLLYQHSGIKNDKTYYYKRKPSCHLINVNRNEINDSKIDIFTDPLLFPNDDFIYKGIKYPEEPHHLVKNPVKVCKEYDLEIEKQEKDSLLLIKQRKKGRENLIESFDKETEMLIRQYNRDKKELEQFKADFLCSQPFLTSLL